MSARFNPNFHGDSYQVVKLIAAKLPEISAVEPNLTLEGLRVVWAAHDAEK